MSIASMDPAVGRQRDCSDDLIDGSCYVASEVYTGAKQSLLGTFMFFAHPVESIKHLFNAFMHPRDTALAIGHEISERPIRFSAGMATSLATSSLISAAITPLHVTAITPTPVDAGSMVVDGLYTVTEVVVNSTALAIAANEMDDNHLLDSRPNVKSSHQAQLAHHGFFSSSAKKEESVADKQRPKPHRVSWGFGW